MINPYDVEITVKVDHPNFQPEALEETLRFRREAQHPAGAAILALSDAGSVLAKQLDLPAEELLKLLGRSIKEKLEALDEALDES